MIDLAAALPVVNACFNATSALLIVVGWRAVRRGNIVMHRRLMVSAFTCSTLFLIGYLTRFAISGTHRFVGPDLLRAIYLLILFSHMILAIILVPLVLRSLYLAWRQRIEAHKRLVHYTLPIWLYVSITGVVVYVMLYHVSRPV